MVLLDRVQAIEELNARLSDKKLVRHSLAVEAIMRDLARYFKEDVDKWGLTGLLHDIDYDKTASDPSKHSQLGAEILEGMGIDNAIVYAVKAHNSLHGLERRRRLDKALYCVDPVSTLIYDTALALPSKKLDAIAVEDILKSINENSSDMEADMNQIRECDQLGLLLAEFVEIALNAMKRIACTIDL